MFCCSSDKKCNHGKQGISFICMKSNCPYETVQPCQQCYKDHKCSNEYIMDIKTGIVDNNAFQVELQDINQYLEEYKSSSNYCKTIIKNYNSILLKQVNYFDLYLKQCLDLKYKGLFKQFMNSGTDQAQIIPFIYEGIQELHQLLNNKIVYNISDDSLQILAKLNFDKLKLQDPQQVIEHLQQKTLELDSRLKYSRSLNQNLENQDFYFIFQEQKSLERFCKQHRQIKSEIYQITSYEKNDIQLIVSCKTCAQLTNLQKYDLNLTDKKKQYINQLYREVEKFKCLQMKEYKMINTYFDAIRKETESQLTNNSKHYCQTILKDYDYEFSDLGLLRHQLLKSYELYNIQCVTMLRKIKRKYDYDNKIIKLIETLESDLNNIIKIYNQKIKSLFKIIFSKDLLEYQLDTGRQSLDQPLDIDIVDVNQQINVHKATKGNQSKIQFKSGFLKKRVQILETIPEDRQGFEKIEEQFQPENRIPDKVNSREGIQINQKVDTQPNNPNQGNLNKIKFPVINPAYSEIIQNSKINQQINPVNHNKQQQEQFDQQEKQKQQILKQQQEEQQKLLQQQQLQQQKQREKELIEQKQQDEKQKQLLEKKKQEEQLLEQQKKQQQVNPILVVSQNDKPKYFAKYDQKIIQPSVPLEMKQQMKSQVNTLSVEIDQNISKKSYFDKQNSITQISVQFSQKYQKDYILYLNSNSQIYKQKNNQVKIQVQLPDESDYLIKQFLFWKIDKQIRQQSKIQDGPRYFLRANTFGKGHILVYDTDRNKIDIDITGRCETINNIQFFNNSIISCSSDGKLILYENQIDFQPRYVNEVRSELDLKNKLVQISIIDNESFIVLQQPQMSKLGETGFFFDSIISQISYDSKNKTMRQEKDRRFNELVVKMAIHNDQLVLGYKTGNIQILNVKDLNQQCIFEENLEQKQPIIGIAYNSKNLAIIQTNKWVTIGKLEKDKNENEKLKMVKQQIEKLYDYDPGEPEDIVIVDDQLIFSDRSVLRLQNL